MSSPFQELAARLRALDTRGIDVEGELEKVGRLLPVDPEMAVVRCRRALEMLVRGVSRLHGGEPGTRPLDHVVSDLVHRRLLPRTIAAHADALRSLANPAAHDASVTSEGVEACVLSLAATVRWLIAHLEEQGRRCPRFQVVQGWDFAPDELRLEELFAIDEVAYGPLDADAQSTAERSRAWFARNPGIYTLLLSGSRAVGYCNVMPLEDEAMDAVLAGRLNDGEITPDMIRTYEVPGPYRLYVCSLAILPAHRRGPGAFRSLYDGFFEKLLSLARDGLYVTDLACNAWTADGRSLARSFGMRYRGAHARQGEIHHCTVVPPGTSHRVLQIERLAEAYSRLGLTTAAEGPGAPPAP